MDVQNLWIVIFIVWLHSTVIVFVHCGWHSLQVAVVWDSILKQYGDKWRSLAIEQSKTYFSPSADNLKESAKMYVVRFT